MTVSDAAVTTGQTKSRTRKFPFTVSAARLFVGVACLIILLEVYVALPRLVRFFDSEQQGLIFHTVDVGQGDCLIIEFPDQKVMVVDVGRQNQYRKVKQYLQKRHVRTIDWLVSTHPDTDHCGGLASLVTDFRVETLYCSPFAVTDALYDGLGVVVRAPMGTGENPEKIARKNYQITFVGPYLDDSALVGTNHNAASLLLVIEYSDKVFMLTGDATAQTEMLLPARLPVGTDLNDKKVILKVSHHGSKYSSTADFLAQIYSAGTLADHYALISCSATNSYGHPHSETLARLAQYCLSENILVTKDEGNIMLRATAEQILINKPDPRYASCLWIFVILGVVIILVCSFDCRVLKRR